MRDDAALIWGSTALVIDRAQVDGLDWWIEVSADGTNWGNAEAVITAIKTHLQDGSLAEVTSFDNRQAPIHMSVCSQTYEGLHEGEMALLAEANAPGYNTLTWTPSRAYAQPTVFDVVYATTAHDFNDLSETAVLVGNVMRRKFVATLECLPFGRDQLPTTVMATSPVIAPTTPVTTSIDNASSATGWSGTNTGVSSAVTVTSDGSRVTIRPQGSPASGFLNLIRAGSVDLTGTPLIYVDWTADFYPGSVSMSLRSAGSTPVEVSMQPYSQAASPTSGLIRTYFRVPSSFPTSVAVIAFGATFNNVLTQMSMSIDQLTRTNVEPVGATNRARTRSLMIGGSARTRAALTITADAGKTLGDLTILYTRSATTGMQPSLRPYRTTSATVFSDASLISGGYNSLGSSMMFNIPANLFREAAHDLFLRLRATTAGTYNLVYNFQLRSISGAEIPESTIQQFDSANVTFAAANVWQGVDLGSVQLPTVPVAPDSTHVIQVTLLASNAAVQIDDGWLFDLDNGGLSLVSTAGLTRLEVRTADLSNPEPSYWGSAVDGGAAVQMVRADYRVQSFGDHIFEPGTIDIFTVTSGTEGSSCRATYYRSWIHHAGLPEVS